MKKSYLIIFVLIFIGCKNENNHKTITNFKKNENTKKTNLEENFIDSTKIGIKGKYKINLNKYRTTDSVYVEIKLYEKQKLDWILKQKLDFLKDAVLSINPEISDFNNDGFGDLTFQSSIAARGANIIRKLFIFDKETAKLIFIKNSEDFPNLRYNKDLDCVDAFRVYGGTQSAFAKIENNSLREFANVEIYDDTIKIIVIDKKGKEKLLKIEKYENGFFHRFKNYNPLIEDEETK